jgi:deferrochelatase/peroxidase EfeB
MTISLSGPSSSRIAPSHAQRPSRPPWKAGPWQDFASEGSFACLTWIHQDVAAFNRFLRQNAAAVAPLAAGTDPEAWLASRVMGRWPDGSPTVVHPERPPEAPDLDDRFGYAGDANGARCPLTAHVRVVYGRDEPLSFANQIRFPKGAPRLIRRGFSYGPHLDGEVDDGHSRGVIGLFFCARVN